MAAEEAQVQQAPISTPRPELGPESTEAGKLTRRILLGYIVWGSLGAVIAIIELLAALDTKTLWYTLSSTVGGLQDDHSWVGIFVLGAIVVQAVRILFYPWPYKKPDM
ncbi:MAG: hypothetical protein ACRDNP_13495 [Gaiellaceae bacterium]